MTDYTWNSSSSTSWNTAGNWNPSGIPGVDDKAIFNSTSTVNCSMDVPGGTHEVGDVDIQSGYTGDVSQAYTLKVQDSGAGDGKLSIAAGSWSTTSVLHAKEIDVKTGGTLNLNGTVNAYIKTNFTVSGTVNSHNSTLQLGTASVGSTTAAIFNDTLGDGTWNISGTTVNHYAGGGGNTLLHAATFGTNTATWNMTLSTNDLRGHQFPTGSTLHYLNMIASGSSTGGITISERRQEFDMLKIGDALTYKFDDNSASGKILVVGSGASLSAGTGNDDDSRYCLRVGTGSTLDMSPCDYLGNIHLCVSGAIMRSGSTFKAPKAIFRFQNYSSTNAMGGPYGETGGGNYTFEHNEGLISITGGGVFSRGGTWAWTSASGSMIKGNLYDFSPNGGSCQLGTNNAHFVENNVYMDRSSNLNKYGVTLPGSGYLYMEGCTDFTVLGNFYQAANVRTLMTRGSAATLNVSGTIFIDDSSGTQGIFLRDTTSNSISTINCGGIVNNCTTTNKGITETRT